MAEAQTEKASAKGKAAAGKGRASTGPAQTASAADLADAVLAIAARLRDGGWSPAFGGVFHAAGTGETSWHGLAGAVFAEASRHGAKIPTVDPIRTEDWPTPAKRPANSRLDCGLLETVFGVRLPDWRISVARTVDRIFADAAGG